MAYGQTDRQTYEQTDRCRDRKRDRNIQTKSIIKFQFKKVINTEKHVQTDRYRWIERYTDKQTYGQTNR